MYNKDIKICGPHSCGYLYFFDKQHPLASADGFVYLHRHIISVYLGRWIHSHEHVHHIDGNKLNNTPQNLMVLTIEEHTHIHKGYAKTKICRKCGVSFIPSCVNNVFCSDNCGRAGVRKFEITADELKELVWNAPTTKVAKLFNVSDKAIEKRCKLLGVKKPPRGYWQKQKAKIDTEAGA